MKKCDILLVDDDAEDIEILSEVFYKNGVHEIHYEKSAALALTYLEGAQRKNELPKLIISDLYLRGMDGGELLQTIKSAVALQHIPVILLSTQRTEKDAIKYREMGAMDFLMKPSSYDELLKMGASIKKVMEENGS